MQFFVYHRRDNGCAVAEAFKDSGDWILHEEYDSVTHANYCDGLCGTPVIFRWLVENRDWFYIFLL